MALAFIGDSDIAHWPKEALPRLRQADDASDDDDRFVSGHSGSTLDEIVPHVKSWVEMQQQQGINNDDKNKLLVLVACAGENDIGNGYTLDETMSSFHKLLDIFFLTDNDNDTSPTQHLIFLGPKFEPWLHQHGGDSASRRKYIRMSKAMNRACTKHKFASQIRYIDCLTMFSGDIPGAVLGGKATAQAEYFQSDGLHLNDEGYKVWNKVVGETITRIHKEI